MAVANFAPTSIFANPKCIEAWDMEARRDVARKKSQAFTNRKFVIDAIDLLDELYRRHNPDQKNPLHMRQAFFNIVLEVSTTGYPLANFFEGLARERGFGCKQDIKSGRSLIQVAALRNCAEALNYLALCYCKQDVTLALNLLRQAAYDGHVQALSNFRHLAEEARIRLRRKRKVIEFAAQGVRLRSTL